MKKYSIIVSYALFWVFGFGFFVSLFVRLDNPNGDIFIYNIYLGIFAVLFLLSIIYFMKQYSAFTKNLSKEQNNLLLLLLFFKKF